MGGVKGKRDLHRWSILMRMDGPHLTHRDCRPSCDIYPGCPQADHASFHACDQDPTIRRVKSERYELFLFMWRPVLSKPSTRRRPSCHLWHRNV